MEVAGGAISRFSYQNMTEAVSTEVGTELPTCKAVEIYRIRVDARSKRGPLLAIWEFVSDFRSLTSACKRTPGSSLQSRLRTTVRTDRPDGSSC